MQASPEQDQTANIIAGISAAIAFLSMVIAAIMIYFAQRTAGDSRRVADATLESTTASKQSAEAAKASVDISREIADYTKEATSAAQKSAQAAEASVEIAKKTMETNVALFKRQGVFELHKAWNELEPIETSNPNAQKVAKAVNILDLTASLWNHDIIEKEIIYQSFWNSFKPVYDTVNSISKPIENWGKTGPELLSSDIRAVYADLDKWDQEKVKKSTLQ